MVPAVNFNKICEYADWCCDKRNSSYPDGSALSMHSINNLREKQYTYINMHTLITVLYICSIIGILDTLYLIYHTFHGTDVACPFFPKEWCRKVQYSQYSKTFGIPNSYLGFLMYAVILAMTYLFPIGNIPFWPLQVIITFGFLFSLYFLYVQAFLLRAFCTWCVLSAVNFTIMALAIYLF